MADESTKANTSYRLKIAEKQTTLLNLLGKAISDHASGQAKWNNLASTYSGEDWENLGCVLHKLAIASRNGAVALLAWTVGKTLL